MPTSDNRDADAYADIGWLKGQLEALKDSVEANGSEARKGRERMYAEIAAANAGVMELKSQGSALGKQMTDLSVRIDKAEAKLSSFEKVRENVKGGAIVLSFIWAAIGAGVVVFWKWIVAKFAGAA